MEIPLAAFILHGVGVNCDRGRLWFFVNEVLCRRAFTIDSRRLRGSLASKLQLRDFDRFEPGTLSRQILWSRERWTFTTGI